MSPTICRCCGEPFAADRPASGGNPNCCVPCACGVILPAVTGPECIAGAPGPEAVTPGAAGNPFPRGRWTPTPTESLDAWRILL